MMKTASCMLIVDAYNANPTSMEAALDNLDSVESGHKAVVLGNMLELGEDSVKEHVAVLARLSRIRGLDRILLVGEEFMEALDAVRDMADVKAAQPDAECMSAADIQDRTEWFATSGEAAEYLKKHPLKDCCVLIKGSRGSKMENVIPVF